MYGYSVNTSTRTACRWSDFDFVAEDASNPFFALIDELYQNQLKRAKRQFRNEFAYLYAAQYTIECLILHWMYQLKADQYVEHEDRLDGAIIKALDNPNNLLAFKTAAIAFAQRKTNQVYLQNKRLDYELTRATIKPYIAAVIAMNGVWVSVYSFTSYLTESLPGLIMVAVVVSAIILYVGMLKKHVFSREDALLKRGTYLYMLLHDDLDYENRVGLKTCLKAYTKPSTTGLIAEPRPSEITHQFPTVRLL